MKEFLFGWMYKPKMELTHIDDVVSGIEIGLIVLVIIIIILVKDKMSNKMKQQKK